MAMPIKVDSEDVKVYFDCKIRRLFIHLTKRVEEEKTVEIVVEDDKNDLEDDIIEIDTDEHFGR